MKYHKYKDLLKYVTVEGPADNEKKGYKFPMVAAEILSVENTTAIEYFLPDNKIQIEVEYDSTEEVEFEVDDDDQEQTEAQQIKNEEPQSEMTPEDQTVQTASQQKVQGVSDEKTAEKKQETAQEIPKPKKKKIMKQTRKVRKIRKQPQDPLMPQLLKYYEGPINYTLAGYNCKVLTTLFTKKSAQFFNFIFNSNKNYLKLICNHIESKSVGDLIVKMLVWETTEFLEERKKIFDHLIKLMSQIKESHVLSNLAAAIYEVIDKTSTYIKSKQNIANNQEIINAFLNIFYRTSEVYKIVNNTISEEENISGYNCMILHAYLHLTEVQTFDSFKIEEVLQTFITKASQKLRNIPNRKVLGMGRLKIVQIFSFLIRKQPKTVEDSNKAKEVPTELLQELYIHTTIAKVPDFFIILIKLLQSFDKNNILHNEVYKIFEHVLKEPEQNQSALQELLLNEENVLLNFIVLEAENDKKAKNSQKYTRRRGYIAHVINLCKLIEELSSNNLIDQRLRKAPEFQEVMKTLVANDTFETSKSLAGYQMKKNPVRDIMFQKQDILNTYAEFLTHCPRAIFEPEEPVEEPNEPVVEEGSQQQGKKTEKEAEKQLMEEQNDEEKYNEIVAISKVNTSGQSDPKFWINHMEFDINQLMQDIQ